MFDLALYMSCLVGDIDPSMVKAIIEVESEGKVSAFNINKWKGKRFVFNNVGHAAIASKVFVENGYSVDVGLMGINSRNLERFDLSIEEGFDSCINIKHGSIIFNENMETSLSQGYSQENAEKRALSLYNTGNIRRGFINGYVDKVWVIYKALKTGGGDV